METFVIAAMALAVVLAASAGFVLHLRRAQHKPEIPPEVLAKFRQKMDEARKREGALFNMVEVINSHSGQYFLGLHQAGLGKLVVIREELARALEECERLLDEGNLRSAKKVLTFLLESDKKEPPKIELRKCDLTRLVDWEGAAHDLAIKCASVLHESSEYTDRLGVVRPGQRRRTVDTLDMLREMLKEE